MTQPGESRGGRDVVVVEGIRTPYVKAGTALKDVPAVDLGRIVLRELADRTDLDLEQVDEVVVGNTGMPADAANLARVVALEAGVPEGVPAFTVQRNCASGMEAITSAALRIRFGEADVVLAGGVESMSNMPLLFPDEFSGVLQGLTRAPSVPGKLKAASQLRPRQLKPVVALLEGLTDPVCGLNMGETAELLAREYGLSREEQDRYALESHRRAVVAQETGRLAEEITPVYVAPRYESVVERDVGPRREQSLEALAKLPPVFDRAFGTVTAGNACMVTDGAAALLLTSAERARGMDVAPLGRILSFAYAGCEPSRMGLGPAYAAPRALERAGLTLEDVDLIELNEAFAAQVLANRAAFASGDFAREVLRRDEPIGELDPARTNVNGGAIALGHPVGSTGTRLILTLLKELRRRGGGIGLATLCVGGGQGGAVVVEAFGEDGPARREASRAA
ncbi:MAG: acetyl-CoA C-acyltransferase [Gemmatimonadota bacterium]